MTVWKYAGLAIAGASLINLLLYALGAAAGADYVVPQGPEQELGPLGPGAILVVTLGSMALGTVVYLGLGWLARRWAWPVFLVLAALLFLLSFAPFGGAFSLDTKVWLGLMHFTTPGALVYALHRARQAEPHAEPDPH